MNSQENSIPIDYQRPPFKVPSIPPPPDPPSDENLPNFSQFYKTPVIERSPYGGIPYTYSSSPQTYQEYETT